MQNFRDRLLQRQALVGTFVKTPSAIIAEVLGLTELDTLCLDAEHAPFDRLALDGCLQALRAAHKPALVRTPSAAAEHILNALDCGASGVVVPHISSAAQARAVVAAARFGAGGRGYAGSTRAAAYTTKTMAQHLTDSARQTAVIVQIEDIEALPAVDEIAAVDGVDCLFIGRIDLTVAYGAASPDDPVVVAAVEKICAAGQRAGKPVGMFVPRLDEVAVWKQRGASLFLLASEHSFILQGAAALVSGFRQG